MGKSQVKGPGAEAHDPADLVAMFNALFLRRYRTRLEFGDDEPVYLPADTAVGFHRIRFAHGFFASALHEVAHWCIAGERRRSLVDYGYWYAPDGRTAEQQAAFERVEARPQALEWLFASACRAPFRVSVDNLGGASADIDGFRRNIVAAARDYCERGLPPRAARLYAALAARYRGPATPQPAHFRLESLR